VTPKKRKESLFFGGGLLRQSYSLLKLVIESINNGIAYSFLNQARSTGDWEAWLTFLFNGIRQTAEGAVTTAQELGAMFKQDRAKIEPAGRRAGSALRVHEALKSRPLLSMPQISNRAGLSFPAASTAVELLVELGIAREFTGKRRNRLFVYDRYLTIPSEGTGAQ
jgi:Fic family protein